MANLYSLPFSKVYDTAGEIEPGAQLYFTLAGTTTASAPYQDADLSTPHTNPVEADANGILPAIYLDDAIAYRVRIYDSTATAGVGTPLEDYEIPAVTDATADFTTSGSITSSGGKIGYATGAGGTVAQATSKSTGVTLNELTGQITLNNAALAANTTVSFTLTNSQIAAGDLLILNHVSGGTAGAYHLNAQAAAGSASINVRNITAGSLGEAIVIAFAVFKGVTS